MYRDDGGQQGGTLVATNRRLAFYRKNVGGFTFDTYPYAAITSVDQGKNLYGPSLKLTVAGAAIEVKWIQGDKGGAETGKIADAVRARLGQGASRSNVSRKSTAGMIAAPRERTSFALLGAAKPDPLSLPLDFSAISPAVKTRAPCVSLSVCRSFGETGFELGDFNLGIGSRDDQAGPWPGPRPSTIQTLRAALTGSKSSGSDHSAGVGPATRRQRSPTTITGRPANLATKSAVPDRLTKPPSSKIASQPTTARSASSAPMGTARASSPATLRRATSW